MLSLPDRLRRYIVLFLLAAAIIVLLPVSRAEASTAQPPPTDSQTTSQLKEGNLEKLFLTRVLFEGIANSLSCQLHGIKQTSYDIDCLRLHVVKGSENQKLEKGGVLVFAGSAISALYTPPASTGVFVKDLADNFGITKKTYAQIDCDANPEAEECKVGQGFQSLKPIRNMFQLSRDIVYLLLVVVFVIVGIAIMLRVHIDPRTVMTIQNQIPKVIVAILLITFSYAIIGLLIDVMWVGTYFGINAVTAQQEGCNTSTDPTHVTTLSGAATIAILNNPLTFTTEILGNNTGCFRNFDGISGLSLTIGSTFADIISNALIGVLQGEASTECIGITDSALGGLGGFGSNFANCVRAAVFELLKIIFTILGFLFVGLAILIALLRVWISLLKAYIYLIIDLVFAPFWILMGIFPASQTTFSVWLRNIIAQLAVFPATAILLVMASVIAQDPSLNDPGSSVFLPPLIGNSNIADNLGALTAFGFILLTPELSTLIRDAIKAPAAKYGQAIAQGAGRGNPIAAFGAVGTLGYQFGGMKQVPLLNKLPFLKSTEGSRGVK